MDKWGKYIIFFNEKAYIIGTCIPVKRIGKYIQHMNMDQLKKEFPTLSTEQLEAAICYFWSHTEKFMIK